MATKPPRYFEYAPPEMGASRGSGDLFTLRSAALLAGGALALHQLRYLTGYGEHAGEALAAQGHSYLPLAGALVAVLALAATAQFLLALARAASGRARAGPSGRFLTSWLFAGAALLAVYVVQEQLEGILFEGHPGAVHAVLGHDGWVAGLLALALGALIALLLGEAERAIALIAALARTGRRRERKARRPCRRIRIARANVLAANLAGRGPPSI